MVSALVHLAPVLAAEKSKVPFYICGGLLALWAVVVSLGIGLRRPDFPANLAGQRAVIAITAGLVLATAITAVATSGGAHNTVSAVIGGTAAGGNVSSGTAGGAPAPNSPAATGGTAAPPPSGGPSVAVSEAADPSGALAFTKPSLHVAAGHVTINFTNMSPTMHNMTIAEGTTVLAATPIFQGGSRTLSLQLRPGAYVFYCSVPGHRQAGMQGTITVS